MGDAKKKKGQKFQYKSYTPPSNFICRYRTLCLKNVCVYTKAHINYISHIHTHRHTHWFLSVSGRHCVHSMESCGREGKAVWLAVPAEWELAEKCSRFHPTGAPPSDLVSTHRCPPGSCYFSLTAQIVKWSSYGTADGHGEQPKPTFFRERNTNVENLKIINMIVYYVF